MKLFLFIFLFPVVIFLTAQDTVSADTLETAESGYINTEKSYLDSMQKKEFEQSLEQNNRNLEQFLKTRKEAEKKEKRRMILNFALGIFFLIILIIGLKRKRKKSS